MKKLLLTGLCLFIISCNPKEISNTYFLSETGKKAVDSLTREKNRLEAKKFFAENAKMPIDSIYIGVKNLDTIVKNDSIIIIYNEVYYTGKPDKEKLKEQSEWDDFVKSLMNKPFIDKDFQTIDDKTFNQKSLNNKPTLVNLWFTTCAPCIEEMPFLNQLKEKYNNQVNFVSITFNNKNEVEKFLTKKEFNFIHLINAKDFLNTKKVNQYPLNIFLDKNGIVKFIDGNIPMTQNDDGTINADVHSFENNLKKLL